MTDTNAGYGIADIDYIEQYGYHKVVGFRQSVRTPAVIYSAAFSECGLAAGGKYYRQCRTYKVSMSHEYG